MTLRVLGSKWCEILIVPGLIDTRDSSLLEILEKLRPGTKDIITQIIETQPLRYIDFTFVKKFINKTRDKISYA